jgi:hypothetical protein
MKPDYESVLYVWLFFFAVIGIIAIPAFRLKWIAQRNGKKGWLFFLAGVGVGAGIILFNRIIAYFIYSLAIIQPVRNYLWIPYLIVAYGLVFVAINLISNRMKKRDRDIPEEVLDSDLFGS